MVLYFKKRNKFSIKKPQNVEAARVKQRNPFIVYEFSELLLDVVKT